MESLNERCVGIAKQMNKTQKKDRNRKPPLSRSIVTETTIQRNQ